jgi:hypothetical protein
LCLGNNAGGTGAVGCCGVPELSLRPRNHAPLTCRLCSFRTTVAASVAERWTWYPATGGDRASTFLYFPGMRGRCCFGIAAAACVSGACMEMGRLSRRRSRRPRTAKVQQTARWNWKQHHSVKPWPCTPGRTARLQPDAPLFFPTPERQRVMVSCPERQQRHLGDGWVETAGHKLLPAMYSGLTWHGFPCGLWSICMLSLPCRCGEHAGPMPASLSPSFFSKVQSIPPIHGPDQDNGKCSSRNDILH